MIQADGNAVRTFNFKIQVRRLNAGSLCALRKMEFIENHKSHFSDSALKAAKKDPAFAEAVFVNFGFLIEKYGFEVNFDSLIRGWAFIFKKGNISIFVWTGIDEKLPQIWVEKETQLHNVHQSIQEFSKKFGETFSYRYSDEFENLGLFKQFSFKRKFEKELEQEFWRKICESGKFLELHFQSVIEFLDELPKLKPITTRKLRT
jgi:hypothetical protein